jgi:hypothetical protein
LLTGFCQFTAIATILINSAVLVFQNTHHLHICGHPAPRPQMQCHTTV